MGGRWGWVIGKYGRREIRRRRGAWEKENWKGEYLKKIYEEGEL